jgi:4-amino-4-deoxy-L-arabinose transferase-like glycosyltransferase
VNQSGLVMTETLAALLSALALLCLTRLGEAPTVWRAAAAGGVLAAASLCRPTFLACLAVVAACAWLWSARGRRLPLVSALAVAAAVTLGPWTLRNHRQLGRPIATTTHGGYTLLLGNNFAFYQRLRQTPFGGLWDASRLQQELADRAAKQEERARRTREVAEDKLAYAMAFETIRSEPAMFAHACVARVARLWGVLPHQLDPDESATRRLSRYLTAIWYCWLFLLAALGAFGKGRDLGRCPWLWGVLLCVSFTAVHAAYWSDMRMRAPLMPAVCLLAAAGAGRARVALKRLLPKEL